MEQIRARVGEQSFRRGQQYFRDGAIFDARRQGRTLKARCLGQSGGPYRLHATLGEQGIIEADCSCPVGDGGYCKHVAALLLTWRERPGEFAEVEKLEAALERRSKAELVALVKQMLRQQPDLESLLETPLAVGGRRREPARPDAYRRQAAAVFRSDEDRYGWGATGAAIAYELSTIKEIGDDFLAQGDHLSAAAVYEGVAAAVLDEYESYHDEGDLATVVIDCVEGLGRCLPGAADPDARTAIWRALFAALRSDFDFGGLGLSDAVPGLIAEQATPDERRLLAGWVREAIPTSSREPTAWRRQAYGELLLELEEESLDDEAFLRICRETGRWQDLVGRLLALGRADEAVAVAERAGDHELPGLADLFVQHGHGDLAERLTCDRLEATRDPGLPRWLQGYYAGLGDTAAALTMAERVFRTQPGLGGYREMRRLAEPLGRWEKIRTQALGFLERERLAELLIRVHLEEGEIDRAIEAVESSRRSTTAFGYGLGYAAPGVGAALALEVARAAEATRPRAALAIYQQEAERLIGQRGRENYAAASRLLERMRGLYTGLGELGAWEAYISELRERNRSLRALKEELAAARL
jgi:uncharacterized Zn finger protein